MNKTVLRISLALCALGIGLVASPTTAGAASISKSGWWFRTSDPTTFVPPAAQPPSIGGVPTVPDAPIDPPAAPAVGEGSVLVQGTPEGANAIAAITYVLAAGESGPTLTVTPDEGSNVPADAVILACRAAIDWVAPESLPGRWQDKPLVDCGRSVNGIIGADGTITFALQPLVSGADLDVVLVPGKTGLATPAGEVGSTFQLSFNAAEGAELATTPAPSEPSTSTGSASSSGSSSSPSFTPSAPATPSFSTGGSTFETPTAPVVQPALEPQDQAPSVPQVAAPPTQPIAAEEDNTAQGVGFIILLIGAALAGWAYLTTEGEDQQVGLGRFRRPAPAMAVAAAAAAPVTGGLSRFRRPRTGPPPSLS